MEFDFSKLKGRMRECGISQNDLAKSVGIGASTLNLKLNGKNDFSLPEIYRICDTLKIADPTPYFFTIKLSNSKLPR